jgi:hypothetical protein
VNPQDKQDNYGPCSDAVDRALNKPDVLVRNCGTTWAFNPLTQAAKTFADENVALGLIEILADAGFKLG